MTAAEVLEAQVELAEARLAAARERAEKNPVFQADVLAYEMAVLEVRRALAAVLALMQAS